MTGFNLKKKSTSADRRRAPRQLSSAAGRSGATMARPSCVALFVTSAGAALLLSRGSTGSVSNSNRLSAQAEAPRGSAPHHLIPNEIHFDQLMESINV